MSKSDHISDETELIQTYLRPLTDGLVGAFGLSDDAALISPQPGTELVISTDPVIAGVHFFSTDRAADIAWKALAVNVSDLAAKGATPFAYTMALAFPDVPQRTWMADFSAGLRAAQDAFGCSLIGGDTDRTPGPLSISITALGSVPKGQMVPRYGAQSGDHVFVTGTLGDSALGLALQQGQSAFQSALTDSDKSDLIGRYLRPSPRLQMASMLRTFASAALDISDGFLKDVSRLATGMSLTINFDELPLSVPAQKAITFDPALRDAIISGGDDYEIVFAVPAARVSGFWAAIKTIDVAVKEIGVLGAGSSVAIVTKSGEHLRPNDNGYDHFAKHPKV